MVLAMLAQSDWILYAPYNDKTCMRNVLAYDIANRTGHYASRTRFCELIINSEYLGIYVMEEKVKRDSNRVDISKMLPTDTVGNDVSGGYIVKIDKTTGAGGAGWSSKYDGVPGTKIYYQYEYPSDIKIVAKQSTYIQAYIDTFERALFSSWFLNTDSGYKNYIDVQSFVDYLNGTKHVRMWMHIASILFYARRKIRKAENYLLALHGITTLHFGMLIIAKDI